MLQTVGGVVRAWRWARRATHVWRCYSKTQGCQVSYPGPVRYVGHGFANTSSLILEFMQFLTIPCYPPKTKHLHHQRKLDRPAAQEVGRAPPQCDWGASTAEGGFHLTLKGWLGVQPLERQGQAKWFLWLEFCCSSRPHW